MNGQQPVSVAREVLELKGVKADEIVRANIELHRGEAPLYDRIHEEIYNPVESVRIDHRLGRALQELRTTKGRALDFGAGTGNVAIRLSNLGFDVVAFELSLEMLLQMKRKRGAGRISCAVGVDMPFKRRSFSLICVFSVLHHVPDYSAVLSELVNLLEPGGVLFLDHEVDSSTPLFFPRRDYQLYSRSSAILTSLRRRFTGLRIPPFDYAMADYHTGPENHVDWERIRNVLKKRGMAIVEDRPYLLHWSWIPNPLFPLFSFWLSDLRYLIAVRR